MITDKMYDLYWCLKIIETRTGDIILPYIQQYDSIPLDKPAEKVAIVSRWIRTEWRPFFKELRELRPVFPTPAFTLVTRYRDVVEVLSRPEVFSVRLYAPKMDPVVDGPFMLARDETSTNWVEKSIMRTMLVPADLPLVRQLAGKIADESLDRHAREGRIEVVRELGRLVPIRICGDYFGFPGPNLETMYRWSRATQSDMFKNLANEPVVHEASVRAGEEMRTYLSELLKKRRERDDRKGAHGTSATDCTEGPSQTGDIFERLIRTEFALEIPFDDTRIIANMAGLLIGAGETTSQAIVQICEQILRRPEVLEPALVAARSGDDTQFDAIVWEALRFNPINPLLFRICERPTEIASSTDHAAVIPAGTVVFACTSSAMFDETAYPNPEEFNAQRPRDLNLHFGYGHHLCLGNLLGGVMVPEVVKRVLLRPQVHLLPGDEGKIDYQNGPFPERFVIAFG